MLQFDLQFYEELTVAWVRTVKFISGALFWPTGQLVDLLKGSNPSYPVLKLGDDLSSRNRDMAQNVILHSCDLERSRSSVRSIIFCTAIRTLPMSIHVKFHWDPTGSFSVKLAHTLPKSGQEKKRRILRETVWRTLTLCDANYTMKERSDVKVTITWFEDLSLNFHLA